ncbi:hypothetical protein GCM10007148_19600 [Parvularcula lutaonensis]|nr:hypothetical protein GCM10007148_19600 [Parvularcula lutaonensis]
MSDTTMRPRAAIWARKWFPDMLAPSRLLLALGALSLILTGVALIYTRSVERDARLHAEDSRDTLKLLREALRAGVDAETGQRGYLLTRDESYLEPYDHSARAWVPAIDRLSEAMGGGTDEAETATLGQLRSLAEQKLAELEQTVSLTRQGRHEEAMTVVNSGLGKDLMGEFRDSITRLETQEEMALGASVARAERTESVTRPLLFILALIIVGTVGLAVWLERRAAFVEAAAKEADELRRSRETSELLVKELNHRVKNLFAVILSIVGLAARDQTDVAAVVASIRARIHVLSLAHAISQGKHGFQMVDMKKLLEATLAPYGDAERTKVSFDGPPVELPAKAVTPVGLLVHELATNASKYGALSDRNGKVDLSWKTVMSEQGTELVKLRWSERDGPKIEKPPERASSSGGFGTLMMTSAIRQLFGKETRTWNEAGLVFELEFPRHGMKGAKA